MMPDRPVFHTLLIHQAYAGPGEPGGTRHYEIARLMKKEGHEFTVLTSTISYLTGKPRPATSVVDLEKPGVIHAWAPQILHRSFLWRVIGFILFSITSFVAGLRIRGVDVVLGTSPPIFQAPTAWAVAWLKRVPFVLEVRDLWPEFAISMGVLRNPILIRVARILEAFLYRRAAVIIVNSPAYRDYLLDRGIDGDRVVVVSNGVDVGMFDPKADGEAFRAKLGLTRDQTLVMYAGALGMANDIGTILGAAERLRGDESIRFVLVGDGKERSALMKTAKSLGLENVGFVGAVPKEEMSRTIAAADICLATLMDIPMFATTYPNKVFDYMAAGRPTVLAIDGVIRQVVEASEGGLFSPPGDPESLASVIRELAEDPARARRMGAAARRYVEEFFDRKKQGEQFAEVLADVAVPRD